jgi:uracil-DNA glycosylase family 4
MQNFKNMISNVINNQVSDCKLCPRLIQYINSEGLRKPISFRNQQYWNRPVPSFGDPKANLLVIGLAPAINGGNRTGRMFTGDSSGEWLMRAMFETGFANIPKSISIDDGLTLRNAYVTSVVKCAPPLNKPTSKEILNCSIHLKKEIESLDNTLKVIVTLGKIAFDSYCKLTGIKGLKFKHGSVHKIDQEKILIVSYHPSRRNTNTKLLDWSMWIEVFKMARSIINHNPEEG